MIKSVVSLDVFIVSMPSMPILYKPRAKLLLFNSPSQATYTRKHMCMVQPGTDWLMHHVTVTRELLILSPSSVWGGGQGVQQDGRPEISQSFYKHTYCHKHLNA